MQCGNGKAVAGHFAYRTLHLVDSLPTVLLGHFTDWTVRLLSGHYAYLLQIMQSYYLRLKNVTK